MAKKKEWQNWYKLGSSLTMDSAIRDEGVLHLTAPGGMAFTSLPESKFDEFCPVSVVDSDFIEADFFAGYMDIVPLDIKKVFQWLPTSSAKLPDWMHEVYVQNGEFLATDNELYAKYDTGVKELNFIIGSHFVALLKKASGKVNGIKVSPRGEDREYVSFRFTDGSFFTYQMFNTHKGFVGTGSIRACSEAACFLDERIIGDILGELSETPKYVVWKNGFMFCDEAKLFDDDKGVYFPSMKGIIGAFAGKAFKKMMKAMSAGSGACIETRSIGEPASFSFIGKDGYVVNGLIGAVGA